jgi:hypothetical protein
MLKQLVHTVTTMPYTETIGAYSCLILKQLVHTVTTMPYIEAIGAYSNNYA